MSRAALAATEALSRGQLARAATLFARAAREPDTPPSEAFQLEKSAVSLWLAIGKRARARQYVESLITRARRRSAPERAWLELRLAEILWSEGNEREARRRFLAASRRAKRGDALRLDAELGAARCEIRIGALREAATRLGGLERANRAQANARVEVEVSLLEARLAERTASAAAIRRAYEEAAALASHHDLPALETRILLAAARGALTWARPEDADAFAERAHRIAARLRDAGAGAEAAVVRAAVCVTLAERTEERQGAGTAAGLRRDADHHLDESLPFLRRTGSTARLGEALLVSTRLLLLGSPAQSRRPATEAKRAFRKAGLPEHEALAELLRLAGGARRATSSPWRGLARAAEGNGWSEIACRAWLEVAKTTPAAASTRRRHALRQSHRWSGRPTPGGTSPFAGRPEEPSSAAARLLASDALSLEAEPKRSALAWALAARATEGFSRGLPAERPRALPVDHARTLYLNERAARHERAVSGGTNPRRPVHETGLWRRQLAYFRHLGGSRFRDEPPRLPRLPEEEALVVFARLEDGVHAWCLRGRDAVSHARLGGREAWREAAVRLERESREARGWPDAMVPETLTSRARRTLRETGSELWTPLLPALRGAARVFVLPDPELAFLPFAALLLAADPASGPWPRSLALLAAPPEGLAARWRLPASGTLAFSSSHPDHLLGAREARGAARVLAGRVLAAERFARDRARRSGNGARPSPAALVRSSRLLYLAAPVRFDARRPFLSRVELDGMEIDLDVPLDRTTRLSLLVLPSLEPEETDGVSVGRVVGAIDPQGARAYAPKAPRPEIAADPTRFVAALLRESAERVLVGTEPETRVHPSPVPGAFCAGLARGDAPAEALFLAQRHAWEEGIHPVLWSGYSLWERV